MPKVLFAADVISEDVGTGEMTIGDVARHYDVSLRALRFYEDKQLLRPRRQGTSRFYSAHDRVRLELILKGKRLGFTLAEISGLLALRLSESSSETDTDLTVSLGRDQIAAQIMHLERQRDELDAAIQELQNAYVRMAGPLAAEPSRREVQS